MGKAAKWTGGTHDGAAFETRAPSPLGDTVLAGPLADLLVGGEIYVGGQLLPALVSSDPTKMPITATPGQLTLGVEKLAPEFARLTSNYTHPQSNTTLANVPGLAVPVAANATYAVEMFLFYQATTVADLKTAFTVPSGATGRWSPFGQVLGAGGLEGTIQFHNVAFTTAFGLGGGGAGNDASAHGFGILVTSSTAGTLQFQAAQQTSEASSTIVTANTTLIAQRLS